MCLRKLGGQLMLMAKQLSKPVYRYAVLAAQVALASACADRSVSSAPHLCPDCVPAAPDAGTAALAGSLAPCTLAYLERKVDRDEAEVLGFPVTDTAAEIERSIDTAMTWVPASTEGGGPASGYQSQTRIHVALHVDSYNYRWLDPARCDGTVCKLEQEGTVEQAPCENVIMMQISGELETLDGALSARLPTQTAVMRRVGQVDDVVVTADADLSEARGKLKLDPTVPAPQIGRLTLSVQFADSQRRGYGVLHLTVWSDLDELSRSSAPAGPDPVVYAPLQAEWGDAPTGGATASTL